MSAVRVGDRGRPVARRTRGRAGWSTAGTYWLSTVRPDARPHVTTLIAMWNGDSVYFSTGPAEQKYKNREQNPLSILTTGTNRRATQNNSGRCDPHADVDQRPRACRPRSLAQASR